MAIPKIVQENTDGAQVRAVDLEGKRFLVTRESDGSFAAWSRAYNVERHEETRRFREGWNALLYSRVGSQAFPSQPNAKELVEARRALAVRAILAAFPGVQAESYDVREGRVIARAA